MNLNTVSKRHRPAHVLLVEDNLGDVVLTRRAFEEAKIANHLHVAMTGEDAISMLRKEGEWADLGTPDLVLLDLNLPQMCGQDVLKIIKETPELKHLPVVILSSSCAERDVAKSYDLHANGYVVKPVNLENFNEIVQKLEDFWFTIVVMPDSQM
ncbi:MAG: response regulator [Rickettsiales bacterium]